MSRKPIKPKTGAIRRFSPHCKALVSNFWWLCSKSGIATGALSERPSPKGHTWNPTVSISVQGKSDANSIVWLEQMQTAEFLCMQSTLWMRFYFNLVTKMLTFWAASRIIITHFTQRSAAANSRVTAIPWSVCSSLGDQRRRRTKDKAPPHGSPRSTAAPIGVSLSAAFCWLSKPAGSTWDRCGEVKW